MIKDILYNGVKGAFTRLVRLIVYIIIILIITYVIGLISSKKASALALKDYTPTTFTNPSQGGWFATTGELMHTYVVNETPWTNNTDYDLVGLNFQQLTYKLENQLSNTWVYGEMTTGNPGFTNQISLQVNPQYFYTDGHYITYGVYLRETSGNSVVHIPCFLSGEIVNTYMCPIQKNHTYQGYTIAVFTSVPTGYQLGLWFNTMQQRQYYNYDSTDIINSQGIITNNQTTIIQQQQQQNQWAQSNTVSGAESSAQSGISTLQTTLNNKMSSVNGLTQVVLAPITMFTNLASNTCTPIQLTAPFVNTTFQLPCMSGIYNQHFGILITLFATVIGGITGYWLCINIAKLIKELVDCDNDRIEVIDL